MIESGKARIEAQSLNKKAGIPSGQVVSLFLNFFSAFKTSFSLIVGMLSWGTLLVVSCSVMLYLDDVIKDDWKYWANSSTMLWERVMDHTVSFYSHHIFLLLLLLCISILYSTSFFYLQKAFDTVSHSQLLDKLNKVGIRGNVHNLLKQYLSNRPQKVKIYNCF